MGKHIPEADRRKYADWVLQQTSPAARAEAIRQVAKKTRHSIPAVRRWVQVGKGPLMPKDATIVGPVPEPEPHKEQVTVIPLASESERKAASTESNPIEGAPDQDAAARAAQAAGASVPPAANPPTVTGEPPAPSGGASSQVGPPPASASSLEDEQLVLDVFGGAKQSAINFILEKVEPPVDPAKIVVCGQLTLPLKMALKANASWIAPKLRRVLQSGPWALAGAVAIDATVTFALVTAILRDAKKAREATEKPK